MHSPTRAVSILYADIAWDKYASASDCFMCHACELSNSDVYKTVAVTAISTVPLLPFPSHERHTNNNNNKKEGKKNLKTVADNGRHIYTLWWKSGEKIVFSTQWESDSWIRVISLFGAGVVGNTIYILTNTKNTIFKTFSRTRFSEFVKKRNSNFCLCKLFSFFSSTCSIFSISNGIRFALIG